VEKTLKIIKEGVPVQFIPVYNDLVKEAVQYSVELYDKYLRFKEMYFGAK